MYKRKSRQKHKIDIFLTLTLLFAAPFITACSDDTASGKFVAVGKPNYAAYSDDGIHWTTQASLKNEDWESVCYGNGKFVAIAEFGSGNTTAYSTDGIKWDYSDLGSDVWQSVCYGNGKFVSTSNDRVAYSPDGIAWTPIKEIDSGVTWSSVTYGLDSDIFGFL
jgi:hypothetical protein